MAAFFCSMPLQGSRCRKHALNLDAQLTSTHIALQEGPSRINPSLRLQVGTQQLRAGTPAVLGSPNARAKQHRKERNRADRWQKGCEV